MGANSSCCFCIPKAEESPYTENDAVAELVPRLPAQGASASGRSEYYSKRCEEMKHSKGQFSDDVAQEIEFSKPHWSEVRRVEVAPQSAEEKELNRENRKLLKQLTEEYPRLFRGNLENYVLGRMIAQGGQGEIYEVMGKADYLMKVFKRGTSLRDLHKSWPHQVLNEDVDQCIFYAGMLRDGRFAFLMNRCWGDLRKLIDQAMQKKNVNGIEGPPFPYNGWKEANGWNLQSLDFMFGIAWHMRDLHRQGVSHRDLKASNILLLLKVGSKYIFSSQDYRWIHVADFECSIGVLGIGFWRAPEILATPENAISFTNEQWKKADVYSYGMTCFEILTGQIPFDGELGNTREHRQLVIKGKRPQLPSDLDDAIKHLIIKCWEQDPSLRPTFSKIVDMIKTISIKQCQFKLIDFDEKLPLEYQLAIVEEVNEYPISLMTTMPEWEVANLANGSVSKGYYAMQTSLEKRGDVPFKLVRLHH